MADAGMIWGPPAGGRSLIETSGPTTLTVGAAPDPSTLYRSGSTIVGLLQRTEQIYTARALSELAITSGEYFADFNDFTAATAAAVSLPGWALTVAGSGASTTSLANGKGGVVKLSTGATGSSAALQQRYGMQLGRMAVDKWFAAMRFKLDTTVNNLGKAMMFFVDIAGTKTLAMGAVGPLNSTNFVVQYDGDTDAGSVLDLAVALDTSWHVIEMWAAASTTIKARIDGGTTISATMASASASAIDNQKLWVSNGATTADRAMTVDWVFNLSGARMT